MLTLSRTGLAGSLALALATTCVPAHAHVTLEVAEARANSTYKAVLRVGHGCKGEATHTVRVTIPEGVIAVKPMPKPGWSVKTATGAYAQTYDYFGKPLSEGVKEITWTGGSLPDGQYDEFVFQSRIASLAEEGKLFFPTVQDCASGSERWVEIPASGQDPHGLKGPAPELKVIKAQHQGHMARLEQTYALGDLTLTAPWARATPGGAKVGGGFLKISNNGKEPDSLIGGSASFAGRMEVHEMAVTDGIMRMRELEKGLVIKPGQTIELKPGSFHVMFMDLKQPLKQGDSLKATLIFAKAGKIEVDFKVGGVADKADTTGGHKH